MTQRIKCWFKGHAWGPVWAHTSLSIIENLLGMAVASRTCARCGATRRRSVSSLEKAAAMSDDGVVLDFGDPYTTVGAKYRMSDEVDAMRARGGA